MIAIQADGCIVNNTPKYERDNDSLVVDFSIKKDRKIEKLKTIMDECNLSYNVRIVDECNRVKISVKGMEHLKDKIKNFILYYGSVYFAVILLVSVLISIKHKWLNI